MDGLSKRDRKRLQNRKRAILKASDDENLNKDEEQRLIEAMSVGAIANGAADDDDVVVVSGRRSAPLTKKQLRDQRRAKEINMLSEQALRAQNEAIESPIKQNVASMIDSLASKAEASSTKLILPDHDGGGGDDDDADDDGWESGSVSLEGDQLAPPKPIESGPSSRPIDPGLSTKSKVTDENPIEITLALDEEPVKKKKGSGRIPGEKKWREEWHASELNTRAAYLCRLEILASASDEYYARLLSILPLECVRESDDTKRLEALMTWFEHNIGKRVDKSLRTASMSERSVQELPFNEAALSTEQCALLFASFARALRIPTRIVMRIRVTPIYRSRPTTKKTGGKRKATAPASTAANSKSPPKKKSKTEKSEAADSADEKKTKKAAKVRGKKASKSDKMAGIAEANAGDAEASVSSKYFTPVKLSKKKSRANNESADERCTDATQVDGASSTSTLGGDFDAMSPPRYSQESIALVDSVYRKDDDAKKTRSSHSKSGSKRGKKRAKSGSAAKAKRVDVVVIGDSDEEKHDEAQMSVDEDGDADFRLDEEVSKHADEEDLEEDSVELVPEKKRRKGVAARKNGTAKKATKAKRGAARRLNGTATSTSTSAAATSAAPVIQPRALASNLVQSDYWCEAVLGAHVVVVDPVNALIGREQCAHLFDVGAPPYILGTLQYVATDVTLRYTQDYAESSRDRLPIDQNLCRLLESMRRTLICANLYESIDFLGRRRMLAADAREFRRTIANLPMPSSKIHFKNHPIYVLECQLLNYEAIYPRIKIGTFKDMDVFPRTCVQTLHTYDKWLQEIREVKAGEQPLKRVKARKMPSVKAEYERLEREHKGEEEKRSGLFARHQTMPYVPPQVVNGRIPRNTYGNLYMFSPSMLPDGCVHIRMEGLRSVARKLKIDAVPAMTGWDVKGGRSFPRLTGCVVLEENVSVLLDAYNQQQQALLAKEAAERRARAAARWHRLAHALLTRKRLIESYGVV